MRRFLIQTVFIFVLSLACALAHSYIRGDTLMIFKSYRPEPATDPGEVQIMIERIGVETLKALLDSDQIILLDARDPADFHRGHIPSARNFPVRYFDSRINEWMPRLNPERMIVTYCSEESCLDSRLLAEKLFHYGFQRLAVFPGGMARWRGMGYGIEKGEGYR